MATYRNNQSSSSVMSVPRRNRSSKIGVKSSNRPRSLGLYPSTTSGSVLGTNGIYTASLFLGNSPANSGSYLKSLSGSFNPGKPAKGFSSYITSGNNYGSIPSKYTSGISSTNFSTYGGTTSGYGGLHLSSSALNLSPSSSSFYTYNPSGLNSFRSASLIRSNSSRVSPTLRNSSGLSVRSRSSSLTSLASSTLSGSEGYSSGPDSSRLSASPVGDTAGTIKSTSVRSKENSENGEVDYKLLYEATVLENERLREKLQKTEDALSDAKSQLDKSSVIPTKNSLSEIEKRERRAMERKLSEMEEELKLLEQYKSENQKLKDENGALIRVISKLSK